MDKKIRCRRAVKPAKRKARSEERKENEEIEN
jgi:hypothetical protein